MDDTKLNGSWVMTQLENEILHREILKLEGSLREISDKFCSILMPYFHEVHGLVDCREDFRKLMGMCVFPTFSPNRKTDEFIVLDDLSLHFKQAILRHACKNFLEDLKKAKEHLPWEELFPSGKDTNEEHKK